MFRFSAMDDAIMFTVQKAHIFCDVCRRTAERLMIFVADLLIEVSQYMEIFRSGANITSRSAAHIVRLH